MEQEKIVMVKIGDKAWIPVHVLAYDHNDANVKALAGVSSAGIDFQVSPTIIVDFEQSPLNIQYRNLAEAEKYK